ncbi:hypothetical protein D3C87_1743970 [compost metagenome]
MTAKGVQVGNHGLLFMSSFQVQANVSKGFSFFPYQHQQVEYQVGTFIDEIFISFIQCGNYGFYSFFAYLLSYFVQAFAP